MHLLSESCQEKNLINICKLEQEFCFMLPVNENGLFTASAPICMLRCVLQSEVKVPFISNSTNLCFSLCTIAWINRNPG